MITKGYHRPVRALSVLLIDDDPLVLRTVSETLVSWSEVQRLNSEDDLTGLLGELEDLTASPAPTPRRKGAQEEGRCHHTAVGAVRVARSGEEALRVADDMMRDPEGLDVVLCDVRMPGMSGFETVARLKSRYPHLHVAFVTGFADAYKEQEGTNSEVPPYEDAVFIQKPCRRRALMNFIDSCSVVPS